MQVFQFPKASCIPFTIDKDTMDVLKFFVSDEKRLQLAKIYIINDVSFWKQVIFSDESKLNAFISNGRQIVWWKKNTEINPENLRASVKHRDGTVPASLEYISAVGVVKLNFIDGIVDYHVRIDILK